MHYCVELLGRACRDSWALVSGAPLPSLVFAAFVFGVALLMIRRWLGHAAMKDELRAAGVSLAATASVALVVLLAHIAVISPARIYSEKEAQRLKAQTIAETQSAKTAALDDRLATLETRLSQQIAKLQEDNQLLRDKLADARAARPLELKVPKDAPLQKVEAPVIEAIRWVPEPLTTSPHSDAPYGVKVTVQTNVTLQPGWQLLFFCDVPVVRGEYVPPLRGGTGMSGGSRGVATVDPKVYSVYETIQPFEPDVPIVVRLYAATPIKVVRLQYVRR